MENPIRGPCGIGCDSAKNRMQRDVRRGRSYRVNCQSAAAPEKVRRRCEVGRCGRVLSDFAGAAGARPASGEGKLELTKAPRSRIVAAGIPEGFHSRLPWRGCRGRRGSERSYRTCQETRRSGSRSRYSRTTSTYGSEYPQSRRWSHRDCPSFVSRVDYLYDHKAALALHVAPARCRGHIIFSCESRFEFAEGVPINRQHLGHRRYRASNRIRLMRTGVRLRTGCLLYSPGH